MEGQDVLNEREIQAHTLVEGLGNVFLPAVNVLDVQIERTIETQLALEQKLLSLGQVLDEIEKKANIPSINEYAERVRSAKKRLEAANQSLRIVTTRVENLNKLASQVTNKD